MAPYDHSDFSGGPTLIIPPLNNAQMPHDGVPSPPYSSAMSNIDSAFPESYCNNSTSWTPADSAATLSTNPSRKRSRDETDFASTLDGYYSPSQQVKAPAPIPEEPVYGEGMVLLNPRAGISISAESQTGTWYEEKVESESKPPPPSENRPKMPSSRKSVRLDPAAPLLSRLDHVGVAAAASESPTKSPSFCSTVYDFTYALGIGWTRLTSEDPDIRAAARGWARYLENHYSHHIHGAEILLKSEGLNAYLVGSQQGFYLFSEDLLEGRLVGRNWESCLTNLRTHPVAFETNEILRADRTPGPDSRFVDEVYSSGMVDGDPINSNDDAANGHMEID